VLNRCAHADAYGVDNGRPRRLALQAALSAHLAAMTAPNVIAMVHSAKRVDPFGCSTWTLEVCDPGPPW
jgi:hypothetical protein